MRIEKRVKANHWWRIVLLAIGCLALTLGITACGSSGDDSTAATTNADSSGGSESSEQKEALAFLEENATNGVGATLPSKPSKAQSGEDVWILSCAQAAAGCAEIAKGANEAVKTAGWNPTLVDGQGDPAKWNAAVEQARVSGAGALILVDVACGPIQQSLKRAKASGLIVESIYGQDCDLPSQGGTESLYTHSLEMQEGAKSPQGFVELAGALQAKWAIANIDGKKEAIMFPAGSVPTVETVNKGFEAAFDCSDCSIAGSVPWTIAELGSPITQKAQTAMLKYPQANLMMSGVGPVAEYTAPAIVNTGKTDTILNTGSSASPQNLELIRDDRGQSMAVATDGRWFGYAATDDVVRLFNDETPVFSGFSAGIVDTENPYAGEEFHSPVDYVSNYRKLWGVN